MKLAEALLERKRIKDEIHALRLRVISDALVQEGDRPAENPAELMLKISELADRLEKLTAAVNFSNISTLMPDGRTVMEAIARRDMLKLMHEIAKDLADAAADTRGYRTTRSEIRYVPTVNVSDWRKKADKYAKEYRELDAAIQAVNWSADLKED